MLQSHMHACETLGQKALWMRLLEQSAVALSPHESLFTNKMSASLSLSLSLQEAQSHPVTSLTHLVTQRTISEEGVLEAAATETFTGFAGPADYKTTPR